LFAQAIDARDQEASACIPRPSFDCIQRPATPPNRRPKACQHPLIKAALGFTGDRRWWPRAACFDLCRPNAPATAFRSSGLNWAVGQSECSCCQRPSSARGRPIAQGLRPDLTDHGCGRPVYATNSRRGISVHPSIAPKADCASWEAANGPPSPLSHGWRADHADRRPYARPTAPPGAVTAGCALRSSGVQELPAQSPPAICRTQRPYLFATTPRNGSNNEVLGEEAVRTALADLLSGLPIFERIDEVAKSLAGQPYLPNIGPQSPPIFGPSEHAGSGRAR